MKFLTSAFALALAFALTLALALALPTFAKEGEGEDCKHACQPGKFEMVHATGMVYCVNCALKAEFGANVDCSKSGHRWAVKVSKAESFCGEERTDIANKTIFCLDTDAAKGLADIKLGATTVVSGRLYNDLPVIQVEEVKVTQTSVDNPAGCSGCPGEGEKKGS